MLSVFVILCISCALWGGWFVSTYVVSSLFAEGYPFDFCGDSGLVEACRGEFAGDVLYL